MTIYVEEEEVWKCPKHPSRRRRNGVCPACLRDRLVSLCPDCGSIRPCPCSCAAFSSSSSSSEGEPSFRRSRSLAIPFLSRANSKTPSFLSVLTRSKTRRSDPMKAEIAAVDGAENNRIQDFARLVTRSRTVTASRFRRTKFWNFTSPFKVFRNSKTPKIVVPDRSPLQRG